MHPLTCRNDSGHALLEPIKNANTGSVSLVCPDCAWTQAAIPSYVFELWFLAEIERLQADLATERALAAGSTAKYKAEIERLQNLLEPCFGVAADVVAQKDREIDRLSKRLVDAVAAVGVAEFAEKYVEAFENSAFDEPTCRDNLVSVVREYRERPRHG